ncbi:MAG: hypothetical protein ABIN97_11475 [Ginsengibacter sp.]
METDNKKILISNDSLIRDIQYEFSAYYPFLKIEFYAAGNKEKNGRSILLDPLTLLKQLATVTPGAIDINPNKSVAEVSQYLQGILGVIVKVCRKSGNVWNTISLSDNWTLQSQNMAAEFICSEMEGN